MTIGVNTMKAGGLANTSGWVNESLAAPTPIKIGDDNTATYLRRQGATTGFLYVGVFDLALAAGEVVLGVRFAVRTSRNPGSRVAFQVGRYNKGTYSFGPATVYTGAATNVWAYGPWQTADPSGARWNQASLNECAVRVSEYKTGGDITWFKEVWVEVRIGTNLTCTVTEPVEASTLTDTNVVTLGATVSDSDDSVSAVTNKARTSNVATLTVGSHRFGVGEVVTVAIGDATFDGAWTITAVTATTVSYACTGSNVGASASGSVTSHRTRPVSLMEFRVFSAAQYSAGGFNPSTSAFVDQKYANAVGEATPQSRVVESVPLPNGNYRVYCRAVQETGAWSAWDYNSFTVAITPPATPSLTGSFDPVLNRVDLEVQGAVAGDFVATGMLVEWSVDGVTWATVYGGEALDGGVTQLAALVDYAAPRGFTVYYRATQYATLAGITLASVPSSVISVTTVNDGAHWLKAAADPSLNAVVAVINPPRVTVYEEAVTVHEPIDGELDEHGQTVSIVVTGDLAAPRGSLMLRAKTPEERAQIRALTLHQGPVLHQECVTCGGGQRWIHLHGARTVTDDLWCLTIAAEWVSVAVPSQK